MGLLALITCAWALLKFGLFALAVFIVYKDLRAMWVCRKLKKLTVPDYDVTMEDLVEVLQNNAPERPRQPFSWTVFDDNLDFSTRSSITDFQLKETGESLVCRIHRGTTLMDEVTFTISGAFISNVKMERYMFGRRIPFVGYSKPLVANGTKKFTQLFKLDWANADAIYGLYHYVKFYSCSSASAQSVQED